MQDALPYRAVIGFPDPFRWWNLASSVLSYNLFLQGHIVFSPEGEPDEEGNKEANAIPVKIGQVLTMYGSGVRDAAISYILVGFAHVETVHGNQE